MKYFHPEKNQNIKSGVNLTVFMCGVITIFIGGLFLLFWVLGIFYSIGPRLKFIPMADETALLFIIFGFALTFLQKSLDSRKLQYLLSFSVTLILIFGILSLIDIGTGDIWNFSNFLGGRPLIISGTPSGSMSFLTAICFILIAVAYLLLQRKSNQVSVIFSSLALFIGYIVVVGYAYGVPILYGGKTVPMALLTAITIIISSIGLLFSAGNEIYPVKYFRGDSVRAQLMRIMIPTVFILSQIQSFFLSLYSLRFGPSFALTNSISSIGLLLVSGIIIFIISRSIGKINDKNLAERNKAEESLRESEENFRLIFENNSAAIAIIEPNATISMVNDEYCLMTGYTRNEIKGGIWTQRIPNDDLDRLIEYRRKRFINSEDVPTKYEFTYYHKNGEVRHAMMSIALLHNRRIIASSIDITERMNMEIELRQKTEQLLKLNAEKDKFFSIVAHDLRSPFNGFLGLTEIMVNELTDMTNIEIQEFSMILHKSANNLYNLLGNLLEWSYMQRGFTDYNPSTFLLHPKINQSLILSIESAKKKEIVMDFNIPDELSIFADPHMFESTIQNLTNNAVKFTPRGGRITISGELSPNSEVLISVQDSGIGMNRTIIDNLFLIDVNTSRKGTEGESSTGLGLILCKDFIEKHGGKLWVESEEGKGSTFRFTLLESPESI